MRLRRALHRRPTTRQEAVALRRQQQERQLDVGALYRRSRTLTPQREVSPPLSDVAPSSSLRLSAHQLRRRRRRLTGYFLSTVVAAGVLLAVLCRLTVTVQFQAVDGVQLQQAEHYGAVIDEYFAARPVERLQFFTDQQALTGFFSQHTPEVKHAAISPGGPAIGRLQLAFRRPVAQWSSGNATYFVDETGMTFEKNYFATPTLTVTDQSGVPTDAGREVVNRRFLSFLGQAVAQLAQQRMTVSEAVLPPGTVRQLWLKIEQRPYVIKMTIDREATAQVQQATTAIAQLDARGVRPGYIDVRADRRVFYK